MAVKVIEVLDIKSAIGDNPHTKSSFLGPVNSAPGRI